MRSVSLYAELYLGYSFYFSRNILRLYSVIAVFGMQPLNLLVFHLNAIYISNLYPTL